MGQPAKAEPGHDLHDPVDQQPDPEDDAQREQARPGVDDDASAVILVTVMFAIPFRSQTSQPRQFLQLDAILEGIGRDHLLAQPCLVARAHQCSSQTPVVTRDPISDVISAASLFPMATPRCPGVLCTGPLCMSIRHA